MAPLILLLLIATPFLEITSFIVVGGWIGVLPTLGLLVLSMTLGMALLRGRGLGALARGRGAINPARMAAELGDTLFLALAGLLFLIPGFFTDLLALPLLLPPVRALLMVVALRRLTVVASAGVAGIHPDPAEGVYGAGSPYDRPQGRSYSGAGTGPEIDGEFRDVSDGKEQGDAVSPSGPSATDGAAPRMLSEGANRDRPNQPFNGESNP